MLRLLPGIKRRLTRRNDASSDAADAGLRAKRPGVLAKHRYICQGCLYTARVAQHLDVHHFDDDHHNNDDANLAPACHTCHPYQHIGELSVRADEWGEGLGKKSTLATIPEVDAVDMNLLQRALGAALLDPAEAEIAEQIHVELLRRADFTRECAFGTSAPRDFAAAMAQLNPEQYEAREEVLGDQRLLFSKGVLERLGREFKADYPSLPVSTWDAIADSLLPKAAG